VSAEPATQADSPGRPLERLHSRRRARRGCWLLAAAALAATILLGNRELLDGRAAPQWDAEWAFGPWFTLVADMARAGQFLSWNPWNNGGSPDGAEPQAGAYSPLVVGLGAALGGTLRSFCVYWLLTWCSAAWGMLLLARHLRAPPWGGFVAALGFAYSGFFTGHAEHTPFLHAFAALPWIVWRLDCALVRRQTRPAVEAGALWGLCALAGYPAVVMLDIGLAILWAVGRVLFPSRGPGCRPLGGSARATSAGAAVGLMLAVGIVVLLPTYLGFLFEARGYSSRSGPISRAVSVSSNALAPGAVATLASPYLATLRFSNTDLWHETDASSSSIYVGAVVLWLALLALAGRPRAGARWCILGLGLIGLGLAFGRALPLRGWLYDLVWPSRYFRHAALFRGWLIFALAVLAAHATHDLATDWRRRRGHALAAARAHAVAGLFAAVVVCGSILAMFEGVVRALPQRGDDLPFARFHVAASVLVVLTAAGMAAVPRLGWRVGLATLLATAALADAVATQRLTALLISTREPALLDTWTRAAQQQRHGIAVSPDRAQRSIWDPVWGNKNLLTKRPVLVSYAPLRNATHVRWTQEPALVQAATGEDRFFFASRVVETSASLPAFEVFRERTRVLGSPPLVIQPPAAMLSSAQEGTIDRATARQLGSLDAARRLPVRIRRYLPDELTLTVECPEDGWLLVTDRWARSWKATVNGRDTPIWGGEFIFRAVPVRAGLNRVAFRYRPFAFPYLLALSWITLGAVAANAIRAALPGRASTAGRGSASPEVALDLAVFTPAARRRL